MSSLSSVVSDLVRASMGTSVAPTVTDEELDKHVRDLLIRDAKKRAERYGQQGIRAYLASGLSDSNAPRANKRFLSSVIRSTDEHNKTILKAQALSAEEIKRERREQEMKERRARAEEAVEAEKQRRSGSSSMSRRRRRRDEDDESEAWDRWDGTRSDRKRKKRDWATWNGYEDEDEEENEGEDENENERERHRSRRRSRRSRSPDNERQGHRYRHSSKRERRSSPSKAKKYRSRSPRRDRESRSTRRDREPDGYHSHHRSNSVSSSHESDGEDRRSRPRKDRDVFKGDTKPKKRYALSSSDEDMPRTRSRSRTVQSDLGSASYAHASTRTHTPSEPNPSSSSSSTMNRENELRKKLKSNSSTRDISRTRDHERTREDDGLEEPGGTPPKRSYSRRSISPYPDSSRRKPSRAASRSSLMSISRSPTPGPEEPVSGLPSKMDKYFDKSYDPRLDVAPLPTAPKVPATGLIDSAEFEGWDTMLDLIRIRREDKAEKKRLERMGLSKDEIRQTMFGDPNAVGSASGGSVSDRWAGEGVSAMNIQYSKRGSVREWDMGKEGF